MTEVTAALFPGQGSQRDGMGEAARERMPELVDLARELTGADPFDHAGEGTSYQQPALYLAGLASWPALREAETPSVLAGHSLGELTALAAAGAMGGEDGLRLVAARGRLMQEAADRTSTGMAAVRGDSATIAPLIAGSEVVIANDNSPKQVVIAGADDALDAATERLAAEGIRAKRLPVAGAFHSPHMEPALEGFRAALDAVEFRDGDLPVISCVTAEEIVPAGAADVLAAALTRPVRWVDTLHALAARGVTRTVEAAPGTVLSGLVRRTLEGVDTAAVDEAAHAGA